MKIGETEVTPEIARFLHAALMMAAAFMVADRLPEDKLALAMANLLDAGQDVPSPKPGTPLVAITDELAAVFGAKIRVGSEVS